MLQLQIAIYTIMILLTPNSLLQCDVLYYADYFSDDTDNDYDYDLAGIMMDEDLDAVLEEVEKDISECSACQHFAIK